MITPTTMFNFLNFRAVSFKLPWFSRELIRTPDLVVLVKKSITINILNLKVKSTLNFLNMGSIQKLGFCRVSNSKDSKLRAIFIP